MDTEQTYKDYKGLALLELFKLDRYFYNVAARLKIELGDDLPQYPGVRGYTNGVKIFFTTAWLEADQPTRLTTLTHEVLHVVSKHLIRIKGLSDINHMKMNVAADLSIMGQQLELGQKPPIQDIVPDAKKYLNMDMFEIYNLLPDSAADQDLGHFEFDPNGADGDGIPMPTKQEEYDIDQAIQQAAVQAAADGYSTAASRAASRLVDEMRAKDIPWNLYLTQTASRLKSNLPTWRRPNRRLQSQVILPSRAKKVMFEATMAMDVSGSVGEVPLNQMCAIAQSILTRFATKLHLMTFDDKIVDEWDLTRRDKIVELELNGYGGTYVQVVIDHLKELKRVPKLLVIATDGHIPKTEDPGYRVVWLIVNNPSFTSTYGTVLHVNTEDLE